MGGAKPRSAFRRRSCRTGTGCRAVLRACPSTSGFGTSLPAAGTESACGRPLGTANSSRVTAVPVLTISREDLVAEVARDPVSHEIRRHKEKWPPPSCAFGEFERLYPVDGNCSFRPTARDFAESAPQVSSVISYVRPRSPNLRPAFLPAPGALRKKRHPPGGSVNSRSFGEPRSRKKRNDAPECPASGIRPMPAT